MSDHSQSLRIIILQERHPQPANPFGFADTDNLCLQKTAVTEFLQTPAIHLIRYTAPPLGMKGFGVTPQEILALFLAIAKNCRSFWLQIGTFIRIMLILHCPNIFHDGLPCALSAGFAVYRGSVKQSRPQGSISDVS